MNEHDFVKWLEGYIEGVPVEITQEQWDAMVIKFQTIEEAPNTEKQPAIKAPKRNNG